MCLLPVRHLLEEQAHETSHNRIIDEGMFSVTVWWQKTSSGQWTDIYICPRPRLLREMAPIINIIRLLPDRGAECIRVGVSRRAPIRCRVRAAAALCCDNTTINIAALARSQPLVSGGRRNNVLCLSLAACGDSNLCSLSALTSNSWTEAIFLRQPSLTFQTCRIGKLML